MIVVIGLPAYVGLADGEGGAGGLAVDVAAAASARGSSVELVGKVGDDGAGDAVVLALSRLGVGHAALLRDPARPTPVLAAAAVEEAFEAESEPAAETPPPTLLPADPAERPELEAGDISLALRYLAEARVIVLAEPLRELAVAAAVEGAAFAGGQLVVLMPPDATPLTLPPEATVLEVPAVDDGSFGRLVGAFAAGLDAGTEPAAAFGEAVEATGWEPVAD
ncbi:MAG: hypothetical protein ABSA21_10150 [Candidatus Limnocylindrales bacterium]|jgi:hypothetical protein